MTNLTEKWKAGELPLWKFYYVLYSGGVEPLLLNGVNDFCNHSHVINSLVNEVLAPVPSYEELQSLKEENARLNKKLEISVAALKEYATIKTHDWIDSQSVAKKALIQIDEVK